MKQETFDKAHKLQQAIKQEAKLSEDINRAKLKLQQQMTSLKHYDGEGSILSAGFEPNEFDCLRFQFHYQEEKKSRYICSGFLHLTPNDLFEALNDWYDKRIDEHSKRISNLKDQFNKLKDE